MGLVITMLGCSKSDEGDFEQVSYIDEFPVVENVNILNAETVNLQSKNIMEIRVVDSLLVVSVSADQGFWHIYSLPNVDSLGNVLNIGVGPGELPMSVPCLMASFKRDEAGHIIASVPALTAGKMVMVDLSSVRDSAQTYDVVDPTMVSMCLMDYQLTDDAYLRFNIDPERAAITRVLVKNGEETANDAMSVLNAKNVSDMSLISRLMTYPAISPDGTKVAEIPGFDANINVWSVSGSVATSIVKKNVLNTEEVIENRIADNKPIYNGGFGYDNFFTVQRTNYTASNEPTGVTIEFISWDGKALGCLNVNSSTVRRADIDTHTGDLYLLDTSADEVKRVNISGFLAKIKA